MPPTIGAQTHCPGSSHESQKLPLPQQVGWELFGTTTVLVQSVAPPPQTVTQVPLWQTWPAGQATHVPVVVSQLRHCPDASQLWQTWSAPQTRQDPPQSASLQQPPG